MIEIAIENLRLAMMSGDREMLDELTGPELSYGHTSGLIENKIEFIDAIGTRDEFKSITITELTVKEVDSFAIVRHRFQAEVYVNGVQALPDIRVLQVWWKDGDAWKLIARQAYKV